jgi:hypothetical protein
MGYDRSPLQLEPRSSNHEHLIPARFEVAAKAAALAE